MHAVCTYLDINRARVRVKILIECISGTSRALGDMYKFDLDQRKWDVVESTKGQSPAPRYNHGFTSAIGKLYVFGGQFSFGGKGFAIRPIAVLKILFPYFVFHSMQLLQIRNGVQCNITMRKRHSLLRHWL